MDFSTAEYTENGSIRVDVGKTIIPVGNRKHAEVVALAEAGEITIKPYVPPTQAEIDAQQQDELDALNTKVMESDLAMKAFALIVLDEINALRTAAGKVERTPLQLKTAYRAKLDQIS